MKQIFRYMAIATFALYAGNLSAQNLSSAYFLDGFAQGHELNPAKDYDRKGYFGFPLSNINVGVKGNLSLTDVLYKNPDPTGKKLVTYMHPSISYDEVMGNISKNNKLLSDFRIELVSVGFRGFKGYNTITLGLRGNVGANIPKEFFDLTKQLSNKDYELNGLKATASTYAELGLGHSHQVTDAWRIGGKIKFLVGGAYANMQMDNLSLKLQDPNQWRATANATMEVGVKGFTWGEPEIKQYNDPSQGTYKQVDFDNIDVKSPGPNGFGLGFDLGAEWDLEKEFGVKGLKASIALLDLGFIHWKRVSMAKNNGEEFIFDGFNDIKVKDGNGKTFEEQSDNIGDRLTDMYRIQAQPGTTSKTRSLGATLNVGVEYALPSYRHLKFGFLSTTRIQGNYSWNEERFAVTVSPAKMFEVAANFGVGTLGCNIGWIINFHPRGFNLFLGSDHCIGKFSKQWAPLRSNYDFCMGINYPIGKSRIPKKAE